MLVHIPVAYLADRSTKKPFVVITFIFFTLKVENLAEAEDRG
jgi:hypothetical protein